MISSAKMGKISWVRLPESGDFSKTMKHKDLVTGLKTPQGIAVDQKRKRLLVADPELLKILSYQLRIDGDTLSTDGKEPTVVARDYESRWVAVDGMGNVFFSDESKNLILKVSSQKVMRGDSTPEIIYTGSSVAQVDQPGGVAVDNFHIYWTNKHFGTQAGSIIAGSENPISTDAADAQESIKILGMNTVKSYGACLALGNVYYTDSQYNLYGVKKRGSEVALISNKLRKPRGCAWDGDGTVYVADRGANTVWSFAGNMHTLSRATLNRAFTYEDPFGLAVLISTDDQQSNARRVASAFAVSALATLASLLLGA